MSCAMDQKILSSLTVSTTKRRHLQTDEEEQDEPDLGGGTTLPVGQGE